MTKSAKKPRRRGRPSTYKPIYAQQILEFFGQPAAHDEIELWTTKGGTKIEKKKEVPNNFPTLERFACNLGVETSQLVSWARQHSDFRAALARAKSLQKDFLIQNCAKGLYNSHFGIFLASNVTDMRPAKQEIESSGSVSVKVVQYVDKGKK